MYRIVATDMDETFLNAEHKVPQANIDAILRMRELDVLFVPCSGRPYGSIMDSLRDMPPTCLEGSYVISYNGGCVNRVGEDEPVFSTRMPFATIERLFEHAKAVGDVGMHFYTLAGDVWAWNLTDADRRYLDGYVDVREFEGDSIEFLRDMPLAKCLYMRHDLDYLHRIANEMDASLTQGVDVTFSSGRFLEFNPAGVDKGAGLRALADMLDIPMEQTIGCGDSANDIAMLEAAGVGVVVSNATPDAVAAADYQAQASCDDGVFAEVLQKFIEPAAAD